MENSRARSECCLCAMKMLSDNVRAAAVNLVFMLWPRQEHYCMQMKSEMEGKTTWSTTIYNCVCVCVCELTCETSSVASSSRASAFSFMWFVIVDAHVRCLSLLFFCLSVTSRIPLATAKSRLSTAQIVMTNKWQISCAARRHNNNNNSNSNNKLQQLPINYSFNILYLLWLLLLL